MPTIKKKFFFQLIFAFSQLAFPLITYPYITRTIGAEGLGLVGYMEYVSGFIITITAFGIPFYGVRESAKLQGQPERLRQLFRQLFSIHFIFAFAGILVFILIITLGKQPVSLSLITLGCINILLPVFVAEWYMQGIEAFSFTTIRSIILRGLGIIAMFIFVTSGEDYIYYYLIIIAVQAGVAITNLYKISFSNLGIDLSVSAQHLKALWHFFLTASIISVYVFFDVIILAWYADEKAVGYYTLAIKLVKLSLLLVLSLNVILFPRISNLTVSNDLESIRSLLYKALNFVILLTLPIGAGFYFLATEIIELIGGNEFNASVILVQILSLLPLIIGLSALLVYQVLIPFGKEKKLLQAVLITCISSLAAHLFLAQLYREKGSAIATVFTELTMTLLVGYYSLKTFSFSLLGKIFIQSLIALLPFVALVFICRGALEQPVAMIICTVIPGMLAYLLLQLFVFKNTMVKDAFLSLRFGKRLNILNG